MDVVQPINRKQARAMAEDTIDGDARTMFTAMANGQVPGWKFWFQGNRITFILTAG